MGETSYTWKADSWFGPLFGCTLWILILSVQVWGRDALAGAGVLLAFVLANTLGLMLWTKREGLRAHAALQWQLGVTGLLALAALLLVDQRVELDQPNGVLGTFASGTLMYLALLVYPLLMLVFWIRERAAQRAD